MGGIFGGGGLLGKIADPGDFFGAQAGADAAKSSEKLGYETLGMQKDWMNYIKDMYEPYQQAGVDALGRQMSQLNKMQQPVNYSDIEKGQQYAGLNAAARQSQLAASEATGGLGSTATQNALASQSANILNQLGQQQKQDDYNYYNALGALSGKGLTGSQGLGQFGGNTLSGMAGTMSGIGTGQLNAAAQQQQQASGIMGMVGGLASMFSDVRLKSNIKSTGDKTNKGHDIYTWDWNEEANKLGMFGKDSGVIADIIESTNPELISIDESGYKKVNYAGL